MEPMSEATPEPEAPELAPPTAYTKERLDDIWTAWSQYADQLAEKYKGMLPDSVRKYVSPKPTQADNPAEST